MLARTIRDPGQTVRDEHAPYTCMDGLAPSGILPVADAPALDYLSPHVDLEIRQPLPTEIEVVQQQAEMEYDPFATTKMDYDPYADFD